MEAGFDAVEKAGGDQSFDRRLDFGGAEALAALLEVGFWTILAILTTTNRLFDPFRPAARREPTVQGVAYWFIDSYLWALVTPLVFWVAWRLGTSRRHWLSNG